MSTSGIRIPVMMVEEDMTRPNGGFIILVLVILSLLFGTVQSATPPVSAAPSHLAPVSGTGAAYVLNIEVDYFEGLLWPEVIDAFDFLETYFEARGIPAEVDFNSTNNIIPGNPYIDDNEWRTLHRRFHDRPSTHIHFIIAKQAGGNYGEASPVLGGIINVELTEYFNETRHVVMHEIGHCIGIGLHDDSQYNETYASQGFMSRSSSILQEYLPEDWDSAFAPDGAFGNQTWKTARMWNRYSVYGELYDDTGDVTGRMAGDTWSNIYLKEINGPNNYSADFRYIDRTFSFQPEPGNYTLEAGSGYRLTHPVFVNVTERAVIDLGDVTVVQLPVVPPEPVEPLQDNRAIYMLAAISVACILVLAFALWARKNDRGRGLAHHKVLAAVAIAALLLAPLFAYCWGQNDMYSAVTVNEFWDDMVDRNDDGVINGSDTPIAWHSYGLGDKVVIRDRIHSVWYEPSENKTYFVLQYFSKYIMLPPVNVVLDGNHTAAYSEGDIIMVKNRMVEYNENIYPEFNAWTIID
jgi:hypothetical protein